MLALARHQARPFQCSKHCCSWAMDPPQKVGAQQCLHGRYVIGMIGRGDVVTALVGRSVGAWASLRRSRLGGWWPRRWRRGRSGRCRSWSRRWVLETWVPPRRRPPPPLPPSLHHTMHVPTLPCNHACKLCVRRWSTEQNQELIPTQLSRSFDMYQKCRGRGLCCRRHGRCGPAIGPVGGGEWLPGKRMHPLRSHCSSFNNIVPQIFTKSILYLYLNYNCIWTHIVR